MATSATAVKKIVKKSATKQTTSKPETQATAEVRPVKVGPVNHNPGLLTTTKKPLDSMSEAHRAHIERWEPMLPAIQAEHVWAATPRFKGRGEGPFYLAIKKGRKSYAIVSFDTAQPTVKSKMLVDNIGSPKAVLDQFGEYRTMAKSERGPVAKAEEAAPAAKTTTAAPKKLVRKVAKKAS